MKQDVNKIMNNLGAEWAEDLVIAKRKIAILKEENRVLKEENEELKRKEKDAEKENAE